MSGYIRFAAACSFLLTLCLVGCRGDALTEISGTVTYDGQPVKKGNISFLPSDGKGPTAAAIITDGKYSLRVAPGKKQVKIEGFKVLGQQHYAGDPKAPLIDIQEPILPERYNANSELACDITSSIHTYDFVLKK